MTSKTVRLLLLALTVTALSVTARAQSLELEECRISMGPGFPGTKAMCGTMLRPENPADPESQEIELRVAVVKALNLSPQPDPIVPIAGGPGQGSVDFYLQTQFAFEPLRRNRDILLVDQRGTGESSRMDCPVEDDTLIFEDEFSLEESLEYVEDCLDQLPHDPRYFTTSVAITDLEAVREALGYTQLNLYGVSYGSRVAQHFARMYPDSTRSIIIDGVVPPQISLGPEISTESQKAVDSIFARCAEDAACSEAFPDVADTFRNIVARLDEGPIPVTVPHPNTGRMESFDFTSGQFAGAVRLLIYNANTIALLPLYIHEAGEGNFVPLAAQYMMIALQMQDMLAIGMHNAIMCTEDIPFLDFDNIDRGALAQSYMGAFQLDMLEAMCDVWPAGPIDAGFKEPLAADLPVLLLSGEADPITPPRYADMAAVDLGNATHLIGEDQGHGQITVGCMGNVVADFVESADPQGLDTECMERSFVTPFFLDFSGPAP